MPKRFSTARGREFGDGLRAAIAGTGMTSRAVAELVGWQEAKLSDLVNGKGGATELEVAILLGACRTPPGEREHLLALFRETHLKGWWQQYGLCTPIRLRTFVEHLNIANKLISWQTHMVPGMLQIPGYARAVLLASATAPRDEIEERVAAKAKLGEAFRRGLKCTFFVHELALSVRVGGAEVWAEQLEHLLKMSQRSYLDLRVVPSAIGAHAGMGGPFIRLEFPKIEPVVVLESENSSLFVEDKAGLAGYQKVVESLETVALDAEQSRKVIKQLLT
jgi:hypothetical protein